MTFYNWRQLLKPFGLRVVAMQDHDGEVNYAFLRVTPGSPFHPQGTWAWRWLLIGRRARLEPDGTCSSPCYVKRWVEV